LAVRLGLCSRCPGRGAMVVPALVTMLASHLARMLLYQADGANAAMGRYAWGGTRHGRSFP
jgi:hypothetical protein